VICRLNNEKERKWINEWMNEETATWTELDEAPEHICLERAPCWQNNRLVTEHQMWLLATPTLSPSGT
jgi:hypothetical protein